MSEQEFVDFEIEANFEEIKEFGGGGFYLVPPGNYLFQVADIKQENAKSSGQPMVVVYAEIIEGQDDDEAAKQVGQHVRNNYTLSPKAIGRLKQLMIACGANMDKFRAGEIMGAKFRADVVHSTGEAQAGPDGNMKEAATFANLANEKPLVAASAADKAPAPPVQKAKTATTTTAAKPTNGQTQTRRA